MRRQQMQVFQRAALRSFENEMVAHLSEFSPPLVETIKEDQLRKAIRLGMDRAGSYGFDQRGPVQLYLELMLLFGSSFDKDCQYPWMAEVLTDRDSEPQMERAQLLYERTLEYRSAVIGPEDAYAFAALRNISVFARRPLTFSSNDIIPSMLAEMARAYPEKTAYVGDDNLKRLIDEGIAEAQGHGFVTVRGIVLTIVLMFAFGRGCFDDPLYPWIARTLQDDAIVDSAARAKRLEKKSITWLEHVLAHFQEEGRV